MGSTELSAGCCRQCALGSRESLINRPSVDERLRDGALEGAGPAASRSLPRFPGPAGAVSGRLPLCRRHGEGDGTSPHQPVRGREQDVQVVEVLRDPAVAGLGEPEVPLHD